MAKKVTGMIKLQIPAGKANPAPPVGPALGQHGVNIMEFCKQFNAKTQGKGDTIIPVIITVLSGPFVYLHHEDAASLNSFEASDQADKRIENASEGQSRQS